jgi:hypothetical protein
VFFDDPPLELLNKMAETDDSPLTGQIRVRNY